MDEKLQSTARNELEYILNDDTAGEVRVTYGDGHSEIREGIGYNPDARVKGTELSQVALPLN